MIYISSGIVNPFKRDEIKVLFFSEWTRDYNGTLSFFNTILEDIECAPIAKKGKIEMCRTNYFSEYPEEDDYRGEWRAVWEATIELKEIIKQELPLLDDIYIQSDAFDESSKFLGSFNAEYTTCILLADFEELNKLEKTQELIKENQKMKYPDQFLEFRMILIAKSYYQLMINLGEVKINFYTSGKTVSALFSCNSLIK